MSITKISKKISLIFALTLLAVAMLPMTVFAKEKLPNPTNLEWIYRYIGDDGYFHDEGNDSQDQSLYVSYKTTNYSL